MKEQKIIKIYVCENGYAVCPVGYGVDFPRMVFPTLTDLCEELPKILESPMEGIMEHYDKQR